RARERAELHLDDHFLVVAPDLDVNRRAGRVVGNLARQLTAVVDRLTVHGEDGILALDACRRRGAVRGNIIDERPFRLFQAKACGDVLVDRLYTHTEPAATDAPPLLQLGDDLARRLC